MSIVVQSYSAWSAGEKEQGGCGCGYRCGYRCGYNNAFQVWLQVHTTKMCFQVCLQVHTSVASLIGAKQHKLS